MDMRDAILTGDVAPDNHNALIPPFSPMVEAPSKKYRCIVADPPWRYNSKLRGLRGATDYPTMTQEQLLSMPVGLWAEDKAHLYLWTTDAFMVQAHQVAAAWGFEVMNILVWAKGRNDAMGQRVQMGVGFYFRHACEYVLFCVRGSLSVKRHDQPNVFLAPRSSHSTKPDAFYDLIESMSYGPYLDVFARTGRLGWKTFGNEAYNDPAILDTLTDEQREGLVGAT